MDVEMHSPDKRGGSKSSLRMKYDAEVGVICKSLGGLEEMRLSLGLSKRKISQLLLVDPSAWTRWTSQGQKAPPHIYRALQWYMIIQEKHPELKSSYWLNSVANPVIPQRELKKLEQGLTHHWRSEIRRFKWFILAMSLASGFIGAMLYSLISS